MQHAVVYYLGVVGIVGVEAVCGGVVVVHDYLVVADPCCGVCIVGAQRVLVVGIVVRDYAVRVDKGAVQIVAVHAVVI